MYYSMDKKKAVKLATASAIALSAFVAANPNASEAATNVDAVVSKAKAQFKNAYYTYSQTVTKTGKFADIKKVYAEYNKAKKAYAEAVALVKKAGGKKKDAYLADLDATYKEYITKRVVTYIDAYNYAVKLDELRQQLKAAIAAKDIAKAEELYHKISYELKFRTVILDRVYGKTTRDLLRFKFKVEAQKLRDSLVYDITVSMKLRVAEAAINKGDLAAAEKALADVEDLLAKVTETFKAKLASKEATVKAAYHAKATPKVVNVRAINAKELVIQFNKAIDKSTVIEASGANAGTLVDGVITVSSLDNHPVTINDAVATLSDNGKKLTLKLKDNEVFDGRYNVSITKGAIKTTDGKEVAGYTATIQTGDNVAPTITKAQLTDTNKITLTFSEPVKNVNADTNDFELYIGGAKVTSNDTITTAQQTTASATLLLTLEAPVTEADLAKGLTIKALDTIDIADVAGNTVSVPVNVTVVQ
jgi:trimeric autotransporter adhesin